MISQPLADAKKGELDAELDLYREALGADADVATFGFMSKNADRVAEIERLRATHGHPVRLDADLKGSHPALAKILGDAGAAEGDIVFAQEADVTEAARLHAEANLRNEIVSELKTLGFDPGDVTDLTTDHLADKLAQAKAAQSSNNKSEVVVYDPRGNAHRTYSKEVHGEKFADLAAEFIADRKGWTVR